MQRHKPLRPEAALDSWRDWSCGPGSRPVITGPLNGGRSNRSFLLDSDLGKLVLRLNGSDSCLPGGERSKEVLIWQAASSNGLAPPLLFVDQSNRYLVSRYIENSVPVAPPIDGPLIEHAFDLLERCHGLKSDGPAINYADHIDQYWHAIESNSQTPAPALIDQRKPMQKVLEHLIASNTPTGLCHHDPVIANFVGNQRRLYLIDWEYAANGLIVMDYAALAVEWQLDDRMVIAETDLDPNTFGQAKQVYRYLCLLWQEVQRASS